MLGDIGSDLTVTQTHLQPDGGLLAGLLESQRPQGTDQAGPFSHRDEFNRRDHTQMSNGPAGQHFHIRAASHSKLRDGLKVQTQPAGTDAMVWASKFLALQGLTFAKRRLCCGQSGNGNPVG